MKHVITLSFMVCCATMVYAQTEKGNFLIGGTASFQGAKVGDTNSTSLSLSPNISYFLADRFAVGIITPLTTSHSSSSSPSAFTISSMSYAVGPTVRYYFPLSDQWAVFPQLDYYYQWSKSNSQFSPASPNETRTTSSVFRINMGVTYFIARNVGLEGILYYQNSSIDSSTGISNSGPVYGVRFGLQIYLLRSKESSGK